MKINGPRSLLMRHIEDINLHIIGQMINKKKLKNELIRKNESVNTCVKNYDIV